MLPEWEVVTELEPMGRGKEEERSEEERMRDYEDYMKQNDLKGGAWSAEGLEGMMEKKGGKGKKEDKVFKTFMKRMAIEKQQVRKRSLIEVVPLSFCRDQTS